MAKKSVLILLTALARLSLGDDLFKGCKSKDPDFDKCLTGAIQDAIKKLKDGYAPYEIPPLDPIFIPEATIGAGTGVVHLVQNYKNLTFSGFSEATILKAHMDLNTLTLTFTVFAKKIVFKANYDINGQILVMPVKGNGACSITGTEFTVDHKIQFESTKKGADVFYTPKSYNIKMTPTLVQFNYDNLFDGNKQLGDNINKLLNEEWKSVFRDVGENYEKALAGYFLKYVTLVFAKVPANKLFLD